MAATFQNDLASSVVSLSLANSSMDPRLQLLLARSRSGMTKMASSSTDENEVAVIARVSNPDEWLALGEVQGPTVIGKSDDAGTIVTGRIPVHRIDRVRSLPFVLSMKAAQPVRPTLAETTKETLAEPALLPAGNHVQGGKGVVVGVIDYGGDFAHQNFRRADGTSRLQFIWDQNGGNSPTSPFGYGREHTSATLNLALNQANPYSAIGYNPGPKSHGTHVMDIAAGNGRGTSTPGMAPDADLIFVNVTHDKDPESSDAVGKSFGDSVTLLEALKYIFDKAGSKPAVINVSLGTNGGPHDGSTLVEQGIDSLVNAAPNRAVVIAASNSYDDGIHAHGTLAQAGTVDLGWDVHANLFSDVEMEIWFSGSDKIKVDLIAPNGVVLATVAPGESKQANIGTTLVAFVANRLDDPNNHDNMIGIFLAAGMPGGNYIVRLTGETIVSGEYHAWIERDNTFQSSFLPPFDNTLTIGSISCGKKLISVGSYDAHVAGRPLSYFSSAGPTRDGRKKPEVSAPGHNVWAAESRTGTGITRKSGTSMAAPSVAGLIALMFEEAIAQGIALTIDQTIKILVDSARRNPPSGTAWHDRYGYGRVSASAAVKAVMQLGGGGPTGGGAASGGGNGGAGGAAASRTKPKPRKTTAKT